MADDPTTEVPVTPAEPAASAPAMAATSATAPGVRPRPAAERPRLGLAFQVAAIVGIVACLLLIAGAWWGRGWVVGQVDDVAASAEGALARASQSTGTVATALQGVDANLDAITEAAQAVQANPSGSLSDQFPQLAARVGTAVDRYRDFRASYDRLKQTLTDALGLLDNVGRFVPGVSAPQGPRDALAAVDSKVQAIDDAVSGLATAVGDGDGERAAEVAAAVEARAASAKTALAGASTFVTDSSQAIDDVNARVIQLRDRLVLYTGLGVGALTAVLVYVVLLNVALFALGRRWRRAPA
jgi:hypothetical protein